MFSGKNADVPSSNFNNQKPKTMQRTRVNTSIPKFSRKESNVSETSKPYEAFQQISSKELSELSISFFNNINI